MKKKSKQMLDSYLKKKKKDKTVTKFTKIDSYKTEIIVDGRSIGTVEQSLSGRWELKPSFPPLQEDEYELKRQYDGPIDAGRRLSALYQSYQKVLDSRLGRQDYGSMLDDSMF